MKKLLISAAIALLCFGSLSASAQQIEKKTIPFAVLCGPGAQMAQKVDPESRVIATFKLEGASGLLGLNPSNSTWLLAIQQKGGQVCILLQGTDFSEQ